MFFKIEGIDLQDLDYRKRNRSIQRVGDFYRLNLEARGIKDRDTAVQVGLKSGCLDISPSSHQMPHLPIILSEELGRREFSESSNPDVVKPQKRQQA